MHPEICRFGPFTVYSYGLMLVFAFVVASWLACLEAKREGMDPDILFNFAFLAFVCGVIGARIFYVLDNLREYLAHPIEIFMLSHGGLAWFGGLIGGALSGILYLKIKKIPIYKTLDLIVPFVALAQAIGRIGCLLNGCCFGRESAAGIYFPAQQAVLIPTQLYSSLLLLVIFVILRLLQDRPHKTGQIFFAYLFFYGCKRFMVEFWRADSLPVFFGLTLFQLLSFGLVLFSIIGFININRRKKP